MTKGSFNLRDSICWSLLLVLLGGAQSLLAASDSSRIALVILDACRNNSYARSFRSSTPGFKSNATWDLMNSQ